MISSPFGRDDRGVSTTVSYAITLVITTMLITGLLVAGGDFVETQREQATLSELRVLGQQLAGDVSSADRLARTAGPDGDVDLRRRLPEQIAAASYRVSHSRPGGSNTSTLRLESDNPDERTEVRVHSTTPLFVKTNLTGGEVQVTYNSVREELVVRRPGPFVFQEENGNVSIEAESYPEDQPGEQNTSTHYWKAFDNGSASGGQNVVALPNSSSHVNTHNDAYGPRLDYEVSFGTTGTYYVWVLMDPPSGDDDSVHVGLDGTPVTDVPNGIGLGGNGWSNEISGSSTVRANVTVSSAGTRTLNVWMRESGTQVDKILLTTDDSYTPSGDGPPESEWA